MQLQATNKKLYSASSRLLEERQPVEGVGNDITRASNGTNQGHQARRIDFLAQTTNVHVDEVGARVKVIAPDFFENHHAREDLPGIAHQKFQQLVLGGQQAQLLLGAAGFAGDQVELKVSDPQRCFVLVDRAFAAQQDFNPGGHFVAGKGFGQVVIAAGAQAAYPLVHVGEGADHQNRCADPNSAQRGYNRQAVQLGEHAVQGNQVIVATHGANQALTAIGDPVNFQPVATQFSHDLFRRYGIIFDGQNARHTVT